jgi:hypothetical protein
MTQNFISNLDNTIIVSMFTLALSTSVFYPTAVPSKNKEGRCMKPITIITCISNIDNTPTTKKRQAITGVRLKASTAHSSITTTLMD